MTRKNGPYQQQQTDNLFTYDVENRQHRWKKKSISRLYAADYSRKNKKDAVGNKWKNNRQYVD